MSRAGTGEIRKEANNWVKNTISGFLERCSSPHLLCTPNLEGRADGWLRWRTHAPEGPSNAWSPDPGLFIDIPVAKRSPAGMQKASQPSSHREHSAAWPGLSTSTPGAEPAQGEGNNSPGTAARPRAEHTWESCSRREFAQQEHRPGCHWETLPLRRRRI